MRLSDPKPILDVACGGKMFYFNKKDPRVLFCDKRNIETTLCDGRRFEVRPDVQCDFTNLPFADASFRVVVFDPPHLTHFSGKGDLDEPTGWQKIKYGFLQENWTEMIEKGFSECFRVLDSGGVLIFKWNETNIPVKDILKCTHEKPVFGHKSGKRGNTHWICFVKDEPSTIEAEPVKHGQWNIKTEIYRYGMEEEVGEEFYLECSECGRRVRVIDNTKVLNGKEEEIFEDYPYCHCGAKMDGGAGT